MWSLSKISWSSSLPMINTTKSGTWWVIVAVIDVGVDYLHPDLEANMWDWTNCVSTIGTPLWGCIHGYDFMDDDPDPLPTNSAHGTNIAGILWAIMDNGEWYVGVNPYVKIMALRAWSRTNLPASSIIRSINFATANGAKIINASFGSSYFSSWTYDAIQAFRDKGWLFVVAAGNRAVNHDTNHYYPCDYDLDNIVCVWSSASNDTLSSFSDMSTSYVDIVAPWSAIYNTIIDIWSDATSDTFGSTSTGDIPTTWTRSSWYNDRWVIYRPEASSNVLATNMTSPYADNTTTYVQRSYDLSWADGVELKFDIGCDTEFITDWWADYVTIGISNDW
jgi:subtilisin family serine protease